MSMRRGLVGAVLVAIGLLVAAPPVPAPAAPAPAPGGRLAFTDGTHIFTVRPDGSGLRRVVDPPGPGGVDTPSWSPSGNALAYAMTHCVDPACLVRAAQLRLVRPDGSGDTAAAVVPQAFAWGARWSPDGARIAFVVWAGVSCWGCPGHTEVHLVRPDGSGHLTVGHGSDPAWSPDGKRLAFTDLLGRISVVAVGPLGTPRPVTPQGVTASAVSWSPDGTRLAFSGSRGAADPRAWVAQADGSAARQLPVRAWGTVSWSPDGRAVATTDDRGVDVTRVDGSHTRRIVREGDHVTVYAATWSPDGRRIAYAAREDLRPESWVRSIAPDGTGHRVIAAMPAWVAPGLGWTPH